MLLFFELCKFLRKNVQKITSLQINLHMSKKSVNFAAKSIHETMRVLLINGSPRREGNTFLALSEIAKTLEQEGIESDLVGVGTMRHSRGILRSLKLHRLQRFVVVLTQGT